MKKKVLFICNQNSASSQMAEAFLNRFCREQYEGQSAGLEPGKLNPIAVEVMQEVGIDISRNETKSAFDLVMSGKLFFYVITLCDAAGAGRCPVLPEVTKRLHWSFPDPSAFRGNQAEVLEKTRVVRDAIKQKIENWCAEVRWQPPSGVNMIQPLGGYAGTHSVGQPRL